MKKGINTMSTSFLDLLSGALGAIILLFVIVPKTSISELELVEQIRSLEIETSELDSLLISISDQDTIISLSDYQKVVKEVQAQMKKNILLVESLTKQVDNAQKEIKTLKRSEAKLKIENNELRSKVQQVNKAKPEVKKQTSQPMAKTVTEEKSKVVKNSDKSFYFGFDAQLSLVMNWDSSEVDVDLFLENDGKFVDGFNRTRDFGKWVRVPKKYLSKPTEVIIQQELVPGTYKIHAHLARPRRDGEATVTGFVAMDLGQGKTRKYDFKKKIESTAPPYHKRANGSTLIGELEVTENNIIFKAN
jgi:hypothetical protein